MAGNLAPIDAMIRRVEEMGATPYPIFCYSLKDDPDQEGGVPAVFGEFLIDEEGKSRVDVLISTLSFTVANLSDGTHTEATGAVVDICSIGSTFPSCKRSSARRARPSGTRASPA